MTPVSYNVTLFFYDFNEHVLITQLKEINSTILREQQLALMSDKKQLDSVRENSFFLRIKYLLEMNDLTALPEKESKLLSQLKSDLNNYANTQTPPVLKL